MTAISPFLHKVTLQKFVMTKKPLKAMEWDLVATKIVAGL